MLDDLLIAPLKDTERRDLLEVLEDRYDQKSTVVTSRVPTKTWHEMLADPTVADAICDRLVHNAHVLSLKGASIRKKKGLGEKTLLSDGDIMSFHEPEKPEIDIFTDVEPDDVLALMLLAKVFRFRAIFVVCSENPGWPRLQHLEPLLEALDIHPGILVSIGHDGQPVAASLPQLEAHFAREPRRLLLSLASMEPLLAIYQSNPELLSNLDVVAYGSVNIRWAVRRAPELKEPLLRMINEGFKSLSVFESYFAYGDSANSFNPTDTPRLCSFISASTHPACTVLARCIRDWNVFLLASQVNALIELDARAFGPLRHQETGEVRVTGEMRTRLQAAAADRSFQGFTKARVILAIASAMETQMGAADPAAAILAIALFGPQLTNGHDMAPLTTSIKAHMRPVRVTIPNVFVALEEKEQSKVHYFHPNAPGPTFLAMMEDHILDLLQPANSTSSRPEADRQ